MGEISCEGKVRKSGNSLIFTIPKKICKELNLNFNDGIIYKIQKIMPDNIKSYKCICGLRFDTNSDNIYCPACGEINGVVEVFNNE